MSVGADASALEAAVLLLNCHVSAMPVVDDTGRMIGIVSEADLVNPKPADKVRLFAAAETPGSTANFLHAQACKITEVMTRDVVSASEETPLPELARLMTVHGVKRLPVIRGNSVVGMVSRVDLLRALLSWDGRSEVARPIVTRDEELRKEVLAACQNRAWSRAKQLDVVVSAGIAHLWGTVSSDAVRKVYRAAAENVPGIKAVEVHMHIVPPNPISVGL